MVSCPNCAKKLRNNFKYCRFCGCLLSEDNHENHMTDLLNVFKHGEEYIYLFSEKGNQVVLRADSLEELAEMVRKKQYPWEFRDAKNNTSSKKERVHPSSPEREFLKASVLKSDEIIPASSNKSDDAN